MVLALSNFQSSIIGRRRYITTTNNNCDQLRKKQAIMFPNSCLNFRVWGSYPNWRRISMTQLQAMDPSSTSSSRPLADFQPTVWGHHFLSYTSQQTEISTQEKVELDYFKEMIRKMLVETPDSCAPKLVLIDTIQRLGVAYHFHNEIETSIQNIVDASKLQSKNDDNLYIVALRFRLLRQQGHYISSDVFKRFMDHDGNFKETLINDDVQGLLSLYEAAHMRVHDEEILEEAHTFTTAHLEFMLPNLSSSLKVQTTEALNQPIRKAISRVGARKYIYIYENSEPHNDLLLKFAKLDFNMLQKLHQQELNELTSWWKDLDIANNFPYTKDRLVESFFWIIGLCFEPQYSRVRRMLTKLLCLNSIIDDVYDAYGAFEELELFTDAIQRLDLKAMESLPLYMRIVYQALLNFYNEVEEVLAKEGKSNSVAVYYAKNEMKKLAKAYLKESDWMNAGYIPKCEEYMENAIITGVGMLYVTHTLIGMEHVTKETIEWMTNKSLVVRAASTICRLIDDLADHEVQLQREHVASIVECYIKEYGVSKEEAYIEIRKEITNAWKDINKEFICTTKLPMFILERALNFAQLSDTFFKGGNDEYANPKFQTKNLITLLFVESVNIRQQCRCSFGKYSEKNLWKVY